MEQTTASSISSLFANCLWPASFTSKKNLEKAKLDCSVNAKKYGKPQSLKKSMARPPSVSDSAYPWTFKIRINLKPRKKKSFRQSQPNQLSLGSVPQAIRCGTNCFTTSSGTPSRDKNQKAPISLISGSCTTIFFVHWLNYTTIRLNTEMLTLIWKRACQQGSSNYQRS